MRLRSWIPALLVLVLVPAAALAQQGLSAGIFVAARWSDGNWYYAKVTAVKGGSFSISYVGGGDADVLDKADVRALPAGVAYKAGQRVLAVWPDEYLRFYAGTIVSVGKASAVVRWEDGSDDTEVPLGRIMAPMAGDEIVTYTMRRNGSIVGEVNSAGTVWVGGSLVGKFEPDGSVRSGGSIVGSIAKDGTIRSGGSIVGSIEKDGTVRRGGSIIGSVESDGTVYEGGSIIGDCEGLDPKWAAGFYFFFFLD
jgi:hypothetical protein